MEGNGEVKSNGGGLKVFWGRVLSLLGIILAFIGALFVSIGTEGIAIALGVAGYFLGARTLGTATIILSVVGMFVGLLAGQGVMPGAYDEAVSGIKETIQTPFADR